MDVLSHNYAEQDKQLLREQLERCGAFTTLSRRSENSDLPEITLESLHQDAIESIAAAVAAHTAPVPRLAFLETAYGLLAASFDASGDRMQKLLNDEAPELSTYQDVATTALFIAAHKGHDKVISSLIDFGLDADSTDLHGSTCLHIAAKENHLRCVQLLLSNGANVEHRRVDNGRTPWMDICGSPAHEAVARILAAHSAIKDDFESGGGHVLYGAAAGGQVEQVRTMLERGMDPSFKTAYLWCPLHWAAAEGHLEVVELLLNAGAEINNASDANKTPLDLLAEAGKLDGEVGILLASRGAISNKYGPQMRTRGRAIQESNQRMRSIHERMTRMRVR